MVIVGPPRNSNLEANLPTSRDGVESPQTGLSQAAELLLRRYSASSALISLEAVPTTTAQCSRPLPTTADFSASLPASMPRMAALSVSGDIVDAIGSLGISFWRSKISPAVLTRN